MFQEWGGRARPVLWERLSSDTGEWEMARGPILCGCVPAGRLYGVPRMPCAGACPRSGECEGEESEAALPRLQYDKFCIPLLGRGRQRCPYTVGHGLQQCLTGVRQAS